MDVSGGLPRPHHASIDWRIFMRAMAEEVDSLAGAGERDDMLRGIGRRMSRMLPLPPTQSVTELEIEMNEVLAAAGWGHVALQVNEARRSLELTHTGLPRIGSLGTPAGTWLSPLLEGLYDGWLAQQPGSKPALASQRVPAESGSAIVLHYERRS